MIAGESMRGLGAALFGLTVLSMLGCQTGRIQLEELPERPIAFVHWSDKAAEERRELFDKASEAPPIPPDAANPEVVEQMKIRAYLRGDEILQLRAKFEEKPGRLSLIWPRTGEVERIDAAPANAIPLAWSPDGQRLLIASAHRGAREQLYEYHLTRRDFRPVTRGADEHARGDYDAQGRLVIQRLHRGRGSQVAEATVHRLGRGGVPGGVLAQGVPPGSLKVLPEGDRIVYEQVVPRPRRDGPALLESFVAVQALARGAEEKLLLKGREPTLTPDGKWIVFASHSTAGYRLRRMRLDGTSRVPIGPGGTAERMPSVSPDGQFVVFVQEQNGRRRLTVRRFDGREERVILPSGWSEFPVWH